MDSYVKDADLAAKLQDAGHDCVHDPSARTLRPAFAEQVSLASLSSVDRLPYGSTSGYLDLHCGVTRGTSSYPALPPRSPPLPVYASLDGARSDVRKSPMIARVHAARESILGGSLYRSMAV